MELLDASRHEPSGGNRRPPRILVRFSVNRPLPGLGGDAAAGLRMLHLLEPLGNITILHEPVSALSFISAVEAGLRSRRAQRQVSDGIKQWNQMLRDREHYLSLLAHEVRNPLASLRNAAEILSRIDPMTTAAFEQRTLIERQIARLALLIEEVPMPFSSESRRVRLRREPINLVSAGRTCLGGSRQRVGGQVPKNCASPGRINPSLSKAIRIACISSSPIS